MHTKIFCVYEAGVDDHQLGFVAGVKVHQFAFGGEEFELIFVWRGITLVKETLQVFGFVGQDYDVVRIYKHRHTLVAAGGSILQFSENGYEWSEECIEQGQATSLDSSSGDVTGFRQVPWKRVLAMKISNSPRVIL